MSDASRAAREFTRLVEIMSTLRGPGGCPWDREQTIDSLKHFEIGDAVKRVADKLVRRHPHVFSREAGEAALDSAGQVRTRWEEIKAQERRAAAPDAKAAPPKGLLSG